MLGRTHFMFGLLVGIGYYLTGQPLWVIFVVPIFALFMDVDEPRSYVGKRAKIIGWAFEHRGFFHTFWFLALSFLIADYFSRTLAIALALGYTSHLMLDAISKAGIRPLWPLRWRVQGPIRVGKWEEHVFLVMVLGAIVYSVL